MKLLRRLPLPIFAVILTFAFMANVRAEDGKEDNGKPITFEDNVAAIFKKSCSVCHGDGKQEAGLNLANYAAVMKGSGGGEIVVAGRSSASRLIEVLRSTEEGERMPPDGERLSIEALSMISQWIDTGLRENAGSSVAAMRTLGFKAAPLVDGALGAVPTNLPAINPIETRRPYPLLALATSPRAPVVAASRYTAIELLTPSSRSPLGTIPFPEGEPLAITFSRSGRLLLVAGGKPVRSGAVVLFDVATGKRLATIGDEPDAIIAADISPDEKRVAIGCTSRLVKLYSTEDGSLQATIDKHTDWVTAVAFSPDGKYLATGDRIGNIHLWDGATGRVILPLSEHKKSVRALSWRSDSNVIASCGEDGTIVWWDVKDGWPLATKPNAHAGGVLDCRFGPQGELATCGRDGTVKLWSTDGMEKSKILLNELVSAEFQAPKGVRLLPIRVAMSSDSETVIIGDTGGELHTWKVP